MMELPTGNRIFWPLLHRIKPTLLREVTKFYLVDRPNKQQALFLLLTNDHRRAYFFELSKKRGSQTTANQESYWFDKENLQEVKGLTSSGPVISAGHNKWVLVVLTVCGDLFARRLKLFTGEYDYDEGWDDEHCKMFRAASNVKQFVIGESEVIYLATDGTVASWNCEVPELVYTEPDSDDDPRDVERRREYRECYKTHEELCEESDFARWRENFLKFKVGTQLPKMITIAGCIMRRGFKNDRFLGLTEDRRLFYWRADFGNPKQMPCCTTGLSPLSYETSLEEVKDLVGGPVVSVAHNQWVLVLLTKSGQLFARRLKTFDSGDDEDWNERTQMSLAGIDVAQFVVTENEVVYLKVNGSVSTWNCEIPNESSESELDSDDSDDSNGSYGYYGRRRYRRGYWSYGEDSDRENDSFERWRENYLEFTVIGNLPTMVAIAGCTGRTKDVFLGLTDDRRVFLWYRNGSEPIEMLCCASVEITSIALSDRFYILLQSDGNLQQCYYSVESSANLSLHMVSPPEPIQHIFAHKHLFVLRGQSNRLYRYEPRGRRFIGLTLTSVVDTFAYYGSKWSTPYLTTLPRELRRKPKDGSGRFNQAPPTKKLNITVGTSADQPRTFHLDPTVICKHYSLDLPESWISFTDFHPPVYFTYFAYLYTSQIQAILQPDCLLELTNLASSFCDYKLVDLCLDYLLKLPVDLVASLSASRGNLHSALLKLLESLNTRNAARLYEASIVCRISEARQKVAQFVYNHIGPKLIHSELYHGMKPSRLQVMLCNSSMFLPDHKDEDETLKVYSSEWYLRDYFPPGEQFCLQGGDDDSGSDPEDDESMQF